MAEEKEEAPTLSAEESKTLRREMDVADDVDLREDTSARLSFTRKYNEKNGKGGFRALTALDKSGGSEPLR